MHLLRLQYVVWRNKFRIRKGQFCASKHVQKSAEAHPKASTVCDKQTAPRNLPLTEHWAQHIYIHICSSTDAPAGKKLLSVFRRTALRHGVNPLHSRSFIPKDPWMFCLICMNQDLLSANRNIAPEKRGYLFFFISSEGKKTKLYIKWYKEVLQKH